MNELWIEQIRQKMADYSQPAPEVSWEAIDKAFAASKPHKLIPFRYWMRGIAAAVVLLLITGISIRFLNKPEETPLQQTAPIDNGQITTAPQEDLQPQLTGSPAQEPQPTFMAANNKKVPPVSVQDVKEDCKEVQAVSNKAADDIPIHETEQDYTESEEQTEPFFDFPDVILPTGKKHKSGRLLAQAYVSNATSGSKQSTYDIPNEISIPNYQVYNPNNVTGYEIHHHQPLKVGLSLRYQLDNRWSLESGVLYSLLVSDVTIKYYGVPEIIRQKIHFLGVPLNASYQLWSDRKTGVYLSTGGTAEKQLNGPDWQFSLNGSVGAEYKISNKFSLYGEPGVVYYIPNNSDLSTIYNDRPWNFNITLGLRFQMK